MNFGDDKSTNRLILRIMTAAEKIHQLIQALPENQINEVLNFAEFLHQKQPIAPQAIPSGTLTGLRGIAKRPETADPSDDALKAEYTHYLTQKCQ
jgi:Protein of unknown function (DUF2281)